MTSRQGFVAGLVVALLFEAGVYFKRINISDLAHLIIIVLAVILSVIITVYNIYRRRSMISPTIDGFVYGFTIFYTLLQLLQGRIKIGYGATQ